jgi:hypothetical protein
MEDGPSHLCYNLDMNTITDMVATEVRLNYVGASWVAWHYGVTRQQVYRAASLRLLPVIEVPNRKRAIHLFDRRLLPHEFPIDVRTKTDYDADLRTRTEQRAAKRKELERKAALEAKRVWEEGRADRIRAKLRKVA